MPPSSQSLVPDIEPHIVDETQIVHKLGLPAVTHDKGHNLAPGSGIKMLTNFFIGFYLPDFRIMDVQ